MNHRFLVLLFLFGLSGINPSQGQVKTIVFDGALGIEHCHMVDDTVVIIRVARKSPAWEKGIRSKDRILAINGLKVSGTGLSLDAVFDLLYQKAGTPVELEVLSGKENTNKSYSLIREKSSHTRIWPDFDYLADSLHRVTINDIRADSADRLFINILEAKIQVAEVDSSSDAFQAGLRTGDRLVGLREELGNHDFLVIDWDYLNGVPKDSVLIIKRDSVEMILELDPSEKGTLKGISSRIVTDLNTNSAWIRITMCNRLTEDTRFVMEVQVFGDSVLLYEYNEESGIRERKAGTAFRPDQRDFIYKDWTAFNLDLMQGQEQTFYIQLFTKNEWGLIVPHIQMIPLATILRFGRTERMVLSAFAGMILLISIYYLILFFTNRRLHYLYYTFFIISFIIVLFYNMGWFGEFLWGKPAKLIDDSNELLYGLPAFLFILFAIAYLDTGKEMKVWYRILRIDLFVLVSSTLALSAYFLISVKDTYTLTINILEVIYVVSTFLVPAVLLIIILIKKLIKRFQPAWYFLAAFVVLVALMLIQTGTTYQFSESAAYQSNFSVILKNSLVFLGTVAQFLIFSLGLARKMKLDEAEKKLAQERIIEQLKENEKLKDKVNRELEQKVKERTREISEQKEEIEAQRDEIEAQRDQLEIQRDLVVAQKNEITDSINYAQRIQAAVLPHKEHMDSVLPEYFVLFRPRDIVSGDFYWIKEMGRYLMVVAADCTGHGVPGGFMSMLGISLLNEQVSRSRLDKPGEVLDRLRRKVKHTLDQKGVSHEQKDGMDMAMALIDRERMVLQFAGAYNPLYLVRRKDKPGIEELSEYTGLENDHFRLTELKGDRQPIAIHEVETPFSTTEVPLETKDTIYLFSDGYVDQVGGPKRKKFLSSQLKKLLLEIQPFPMDEQQQKLEQSLEAWKSGYEQIDDILFMGIRV